MDIRRPMCALLLIAFFFSPGSAQARDVFDAACARYKVPKALMIAIAQTESNLEPWVINVQGKDFHPRSRDEALRIIHAARARRLSHDVGIMQINSQWLKRLGITPEMALDPKNNIMLGAWILAKEFKQHGYSWKAVGAYHSPKRARQVKYARTVHKHYIKIRGLL